MSGSIPVTASLKDWCRCSSVSLDLIWVFISFMNEKVCSQIYVLPKSVDILIACLLMFGYVSLGRAAYNSMRPLGLKASFRTSQFCNSGNSTDNKARLRQCRQRRGSGKSEPHVKLRLQHFQRFHWLFSWEWGHWFLSWETLGNGEMSEVLLLHLSHKQC